MHKQRPTHPHTYTETHISTHLHREALSTHLHTPPTWFRKRASTRDSTDERNLSGSRFLDKKQTARYRFRKCTAPCWNFNVSARRNVIDRHRGVKVAHFYKCHCPPSYFKGYDLCSRSSSYIRYPERCLAKWDILIMMRIRVRLEKCFIISNTYLHFITGLI